MAGFFTTECIDHCLGNGCLLRVCHQHVRPCVKLHDSIRSTDELHATESDEQVLDDAFQENRLLDLNLTFEDKIGGSGEGDVFEGLITGFLETDGQSIAAFDIDFDG